MLLFGYAMSWIFATVGLAVGDPETAQAAAFPVLAPLVFASSAFVLVVDAGVAAAVGENQPVSITAEAFRGLTIGGPTDGPGHQGGLVGRRCLAIFAPIAVRLYRKAV